MAARNIPTIFVGDRFESEIYGPIEVVEYQDKNNVFVRFDRTGTIARTRAERARSGKVMDICAPVTAGVGYINRGKYNCKQDSQPYATWCGMLKRCYDENCPAYPNYGGKGVTVVKEWHDFQNFAEWYYKNHRDGFEMDKDILSENAESLVYGPDTCVYVPRNINSLAINPRRVKRKEELPIGVFRPERGRPFGAQVCGPHGRYLGTFNTMAEAYQAYCEVRLEVVKSRLEENLLEGNISGKVFVAVLNKVNKFLEEGEQYVV